MKNITTNIGSLVIFFLLFATSLFAQEEIQAKIAQQLKIKNLKPENYYLVYLTGARSYWDLRNFKKAEEYLVQAADAGVDFDKSEIYINLCNLAYIEKNQEKLKTRVLSAKKYFETNSKFKKALFVDVLDFYEGKKIRTEAKPFKELVSYALSEKELEHKIKSKQYHEALLMMNGPSIKESGNIGLQVIFDALRTVNQLIINDQDLYCRPTLDNFPNSYTYSMLICGALVEYQKSNAISKKTIETLKEYFKKHFNSKSYLLDVLNDVNAMKRDISK
jgi:hypothetical protein